MDSTDIGIRKRTPPALKDPRAGSVSSGIPLFLHPPAFSAGLSRTARVRRRNRRPGLAKGHKFPGRRDKAQSSSRLRFSESWLIWTRELLVTVNLSVTPEPSARTVPAETTLDVQHSQRWEDKVRGLRRIVGTRELPVVSGRAVDSERRPARLTCQPFRSSRIRAMPNGNSPEGQRQPAEQARETAQDDCQDSAEGHIWSVLKTRHGTGPPAGDRPPPRSTA